MPLCDLNPKAHTLSPGTALTDQASAFEAEASAQDDAAAKAMAKHDEHTARAAELRRLAAEFRIAADMLMAPVTDDEQAPKAARARKVK